MRTSAAIAPFGTTLAGSSLGDMMDSSADLESGARAARDVDGRQPRLPVGMFNTLAAEFCSTLMAQAQQLDRMIDDVNRVQGQDAQLRFYGGGDQHTFRQESAPDASKRSPNKPASIVLEVKEPQGPSEEFREPSNESRDFHGAEGGAGSRQRAAGTPSSQQLKRSQSRAIIPAKEARRLMKQMSVSLHLVHKEAEADFAKKPSNNVFADFNEMKQQIRHEVMKPYSVSQYYHDDGFCRRIADDSMFEIITLCVICLNAIWIAVDVDANGGKANKDKHAIFQIVEWCFFTYFWGEILIRFGAFYSKLNCFKDFWFTFDSSLVLLMCVDAFVPMIFDKGLGFNTSVIRLARLVKLARMARIARLLHKFPELNLLLRSINIGTRSVASSFILLAVVVYLFAVAFRFLTMDTVVGRTYFRTVPEAMKYLVLSSTMPDSMEMVNTLWDEQVLNGFLFVVFISIATLTLLNMLIAILCEVIHSAAELEKETCKIQHVKDQLSNVMEAAGFSDHINDDMIITKAEFQRLLLNKSVVNVMRKVGVDAAGLIDFVEYIFNEDADGSHAHGLTFEKLVELICALGGANGATVKDVVDMRQVVMRQIFATEESLEKQLHSLQVSVAELIHEPSRETHAKEEKLRMPAQTLNPDDINDFLQMAVSTWVDCVKTQRSSTLAEGTLHTVDENLHVSVDQLIEKKIFDAEHFLRSKFEDARDSKITDVLVLVKDLQARLECCQNELHHSKTQLGLFDCRADSIETRLRATTHDVQILRSSANSQPAILPELLERELDVRKRALVGEA